MQVKVIDLSIQGLGFCDKKSDDYTDLNAVKLDYPDGYGLAKIDGSIEINFWVCEADCLTGFAVSPESSEFRVFLDDGKTIDLTDFTKFVPKGYNGDEENWRDDVEEILSRDPEVIKMKEKLRDKSLAAFPKFKRKFQN